MKSRNLLVGLTYDLRSDYMKMGYTEEQTAEFDSEETIKAIEVTLQQLGFMTERIGNLKALLKMLDGQPKWDIVFNICEGMHGIGREAQAPALLEAFRIPFVFAGPVTLSVTLHKAMAKRIVHDAGVPTPDFFLLEKESMISEIILPYPLFVKPLAEGTGKGISSKSVIKSDSGLKKVCTALLNKFSQPVLVERYLSGREFTCGITGSGDEAEVAGVMEVILNKQAEKEVYSFTNKEECEERVIYRRAGADETKVIGDLALKAYRVLDCLDAGRVDFRMDENGIPNFIEINPLAGINPHHSDLPILCKMHGISYRQLMERIMRSALKRYGLSYP